MCKLIDYICTAILNSCSDEHRREKCLKVIQYALNMVTHNSSVSDTNKNIIQELYSFKKDIQICADQASVSRFLYYLSNTSYYHSHDPTKTKKIFISENILLSIKAICNSYPQFQLFAFGSRVRGTHNETSDLDIVYKTIKPIELLPKNAIPYYNESCHMEEELKSKISIPIDITSWDVLSVNFKKSIENDLVPIS